MNALQTVLGALAALGFAGSATQPLHAAEGPPCGKFQVYGEYVEVKYADHAEPGVGVGDARVGRGRLLDENGNEIGHSYFHSVVVPDVDEGFHTVMGTGHGVFPNGMISTSGVIRIPDPTSAATHSQAFEYAIVGGTGDFVGARGTMRAFTDDQGRRVTEFDAVCLE
jgi:hypothetical protein